jgi:very-short-patch-repair endonuclease
MALDTDARAESPGETLVRLAILRAGLPEPELQIDVTTPSGTFRLDLGWSRFMLAIEFDGFVKYANPNAGTAAEALFAEKRRQDALEEAGWKVLRFTWPDLNSLETLATRIRTHLLKRGL